VRSGNWNWGLELNGRNSPYNIKKADGRHENELEI
jgi:hypothetical protein